MHEPGHRKPGITIRHTTFPLKGFWDLLSPLQRYSSTSNLKTINSLPQVYPKPGRNTKVQERKDRSEKGLPRAWLPSSPMS